MDRYDVKMMLMHECGIKEDPERCQMCHATPAGLSAERYGIDVIWVCARCSNHIRAFKEIEKYYTPLQAEILEALRVKEGTALQVSERLNIPVRTIHCALRNLFTRGDVRYESGRGGRRYEIAC